MNLVILRLRLYIGSPNVELSALVDYCSTNALWLVDRRPSKEMSNMSDSVLRYSLISSVLGTLTEKVTTVVAESLNSVKLCVCYKGGGTVHLLLATAVCRLLVFPPPRSVLD